MNEVVKLSVLGLLGTGMAKYAMYVFMIHGQGPYVWLISIFFAAIDVCLLVGIGARIQEQIRTYSRFLA